MSAVPSEKAGSDWTNWLPVRVITTVLGEGNRHMPKGPVDILLRTLAVLVTFYVLYLSVYGTANPQLQISMFLIALFPFTFLTTTSGQGRDRLSAMDWLWALVSTGAAIFYVWRNKDYLNWMVGISELEWYDRTAALVLIASICEMTRRAAGWGLTLVVTALLLYTFLGDLLTGSFRHRSVELDYFISMQTINPLGIFGTPLEISASYAFLFVLFGSFFHFAGGGQLFFDIAAAVTGRFTGGPAKACVISSGLYGSVSGSPVADVATTGPINIPLMRRVGISATRAAAIEAASSCGGAMLPPVMGAVAFLMADYTGTSYLEVAKAAVIGAVLYYIGVFFLIDIEARRYGQGRVPDEDIVGLGEGLKRGWNHLVPLVVLVYMLLSGSSPEYVAAVSTLAVIVSSWVGKRAARIGPKSFVEACYETVYRSVPLVAAVAAAGMIIGCIELTGLAGKFTILIFKLSQGNLAGTLLVSAAILILLGMGMPTTGVYIMGISLIAPVLTGTFQLPLFAVHMFILFFACMSAITPPVAVACFTAGAIAGAKPMAVGPYACKLAIGGFTLPFLFLFNPGILMQGAFVDIVLDSLLGLGVVVAASLTLNGWFGTRKLPIWYRLALIALIVFFIYPDRSQQLPALGALAILLIVPRFLFTSHPPKAIALPDPART
jgi:TRAP transporter 4TM/12TM fusion protein